MSGTWESSRAEVQRRQSAYRAEAEQRRLAALAGSAASSRTTSAAQHRPAAPVARRALRRGLALRTRLGVALLAAGQALVTADGFEETCADPC